MRKLVIIILSAFIVSIFFTLNLSAKQRGVSITATSGQSLYLYKDYHALVVGVSDYNKWPDLPNAIKDAREVASTLESIGFKVELMLNPTSSQLNATLNGMAFTLGVEKNRAILFYFAGHGDTLELADGTELGYIIPSDCPLKRQDPIGFDDKAVSMKEIEALSLKVKSKHFLMMFDSCFSGSLFNLVRAAPVDITEKSILPVRQFITAGGAGEQVPDRSVFKIVFLDGIKGDADLNSDGYVTGSELGMHLQNEVVNYTRGGQHPQYGKINNPKLDKGDFIFQLASSAAIVEEPGRSSLSVESSIIDARVLVDGRLVGQTPVTDAALTPGEHTVRVEKDGYEPYRRSIRLEDGRSLSLYVDLSEAKLRAGRFFVETEPREAKIRILNIKPKFYQGIELEPGQYHVEVSAAGYEAKRRWFHLAAGENNKLNISLERKTPSPLATTTTEVRPKKQSEYDLLQRLIERLKDDNWEDRKSAAKRLGRIRDKQAVPALIEAVSISGAMNIEIKKEYHFRIAVANALGVIADKRAVHALVRTMKEAKYYRKSFITMRDYGVNDAAAEALAKIGNEAVPSLIDILLESDDPHIAGKAAEILGKVEDKQAVPALIETLKHEHDDVRFKAAIALIRLPDKRALPALIEAFKTDDYVNVRNFAGIALSKITDKRAVPALIEALNDKDVCLQASIALSKIPDKRAVPALIAALKNEDYRVRLHSAKALGKIGDVRAVSALQETANDKNDSVSRAAKDALTKLQE